MAKKYTNRQPRNVNEQYLDDLSFLNRQQIDITSLTGEVKVASITVSQTPLEVKVGAQPLEGRHSIEIVNDSSFLVYLGFASDMTVGVNTILINSGSKISLNTNPNANVPVYVVSPDLDVEIKIVEIN